ncbi:galactokinase [Streptomyces roseirectus]|uniref:Galactokinase n=1 Tax=Streptomyces roseirectus TaxID=2768066 RepID=A0A7H0ITM0_9ACTN|nr:galactokinase [Streptomyces roseirectus]
MDPVRAVVPCRACLSGEDLDWLGGGRSVSLALGLMTTVEVVAEPASGGEGGGWEEEVWAFLRARVPALDEGPPAVTVRSEAPAASGLSSSTARIVALFRAFTDAAVQGRRVSDATLTRWAYEFEFAVFHGGGMDHLAVVQGGALLLEGRETGLPVVRERLEFPGEWAVVVVDSGTRKDTGHHIRDVRAQLAAGDPVLAAYRAAADEVSGRVWEALRGRDLAALGAAMADGHAAMRDHQRMSTPLLEELREVALREAGLPLKLSGAGGGGSLVGVCAAAQVRETVARLARALGVSHPAARVIPTTAASGVRREPVPVVEVR